MEPASELFPEPAEKKHNAQPEHALSVQVHKFARAFIAPPHVFLAFDRSRKQSPNQHMREASRGVRRGTLDTLTMVLDVPDFWCELKVPPNSIDLPRNASQREMIADIRRVGRVACVAISVMEYFEKAKAAGITFIPSAYVAALRMDGLLASAGAKWVAPKKKPAAKPRAAVTRAGLAAIARARSKGWVG